MGRADELATTSGKTHLVEHLAFPARSRRRIEFNGTVDNILEMVAEIEARRGAA